MVTLSKQFFFPSEKESSLKARGLPLNSLTKLKQNIACTCMIYIQQGTRGKSAELFKYEYQVCSNNDPRMTFDLFTAWSNLYPSCCEKKNVARHLQICNGCFTQVRESWPMSLLF